MQVIGIRKTQNISAHTTLSKGLIMKMGLKRAGSCVIKSTGVCVTDETEIFGVLSGGTVTAQSNIMWQEEKEEFAVTVPRVGCLGVRGRHGGSCDGFGQAWEGCGSGGLGDLGGGEKWCWLTGENRETDLLWCVSPFNTLNFPGIEEGFCKGAAEEFG